MKRIIRQGIFETNTSSSHSVTIKNWEKRLEFVKHNLPSPDDIWNKISMDFGEFGWEVEDYTDAYTKLQYALTMAITSESRMKFYDPDNDYKSTIIAGRTPILSKEDFYNTESFKLINECVKEHCNCNGIEIVSDIYWEKYNDTPAKGYTIFEGYIDHQSSEDYKSLKEFLDSWGVSIEEFIFSPDVVLHTDNDNH